MKFSNGRKARLVRRSRADKLIIVLWLIVAMLAALMLARGEGGAHVSSRHVGEHFNI